MLLCNFTRCLHFVLPCELYLLFVISLLFFSHGRATSSPGLATPNISRFDRLPFAYVWMLRRSSAKMEKLNASKLFCIQANDSSIDKNLLCVKIVLTRWLIKMTHVSTHSLIWLIYRRPQLLVFFLISINCMYFWDYVWTECNMNANFAIVIVFT